MAKTKELPPPSTALIREAEDLSNVRKARLEHTPEEVLMQLRACEDLMISGHGQGRISGVLKTKFGIGTRRTRVLMDRVRASWEKEAIEERPHYRDVAIRRITRHIQKACAVPDGQRVNYAQVASLEKLLSEIQGTAQPIRVELNVQLTQALTGTMAEVTPEFLQKLVDRRREDKRLAAIARSMGMGTPETFDVEGNPAAAE